MKKYFELHDTPELKYAPRMLRAERKQPMKMCRQ